MRCARRRRRRKKRSQRQRLGPQIRPSHPRRTRRSSKKQRTPARRQGARRWWSIISKMTSRATCTAVGGCTTRPARRCTRSTSAASSRSRSPACATAAAMTPTRSGGGSPTAATSPGTVCPCFACTPSFLSFLAALSPPFLFFLSRSRRTPPRSVFFLSRAPYCRRAQLVWRMRSSVRGRTGGSSLLSLVVFWALAPLLQYSTRLTVKTPLLTS
jgi:hypothetical protein